MRAQLGPFFDQLVLRLRAAGFQISVEQIIEANDLRLAQFWSGHGTVDANFLKYSLASIFCGTPEQQTLFYEIFDSLGVPGGEAGKKIRAHVAAQDEDPLIQHTRRRRVWPVVLGLILAAGITLALATFFWPSAWLDAPTPTGTSSGPSGELGGPGGEPNTTPGVSGTSQFSPPPRPPAISDLVRPRQALGWRLLRWGLASLPLLFSIAWLLARWRARRVFVGKHGASTRPQLKPLPISGARGPLFAPSQISQSVAVLRVPARHPTRRLNTTATVNATARHGGIPKIVYAHQAQRPGYVMLLQQRSPLDMFTRFAGRLADRLYAGGLEVSSFIFEGRPARLFPRGQPGRNATYEQVAQHFQGDALIVAGDASLLMHGGRTTAHPWQPTTGQWSAHALLSDRAPACWGREEKALHARGFALARFGSQGLRAARHWLNPQQQLGTEDTPPWLEGEHNASPYPPLLHDSVRRWMRDREQADTSQLLQELQAYLGNDGMLLLAAIAAYPQMKFEIALYLDTVMFADQTAAQRERRLLQITTLPWCREAQMPDYLRAVLLQRQPVPQLALIQNTYRKLLHGNLTGEQASVEIAVPEGARWQAFLKDLLASTHSGEYTDAIFQNVVLEAPEQLAAVELPRARADELGGQRLQDAVTFAGARLLRATMFSLGLLGALALIGKPIGDRWLGERNAQARANITVQILYPASGGSSEYTTEEAQAIARLGSRLDYALQAQGFTTELVPTSPEATPVNAPATDVRTRLYGAQATDGTPLKHLIEFDPDYGISRLRHRGVARTQPAFLWPLLAVPNGTFANTIESALAHLSYTHPIEILAAGASRARSADQSNLGNNAPPSSTAPSAAEYFPASTVRVWLRSPVRSFQDRLAKGGLGPVMTVLSDSSAPGGQLFAVGKYEVTFEEYDRFARATNRTLPDANGWGRGKRPVINVNYEDAAAYADWLSGETTAVYALPSLSNWYLITNATSDSAFGRVLRRVASAVPGGPSRTLPVEQTTTNWLDLHGLSGNVSEWTPECFESTRGGLPGGGCAVNVAVGGNWRDGDSVTEKAAGLASAIVGFRVVRRVAQSDYPQSTIPEFPEAEQKQAPEQQTQRMSPEEQAKRGAQAK